MNELRTIGAWWTTVPAQISLSAPPRVRQMPGESISSAPFSEQCREVIRQDATRIARKRGIPDAAEYLETVGILAYSDEAARPIPADLDKAGVIRQRLQRQMDNAARREQTKRFRGPARERREIHLDCPGNGGNAPSLATQQYERAEAQRSGGRRLTPADVRGLIAALPDRERFIIRAYYFEDRTQASIAAELGISQSSVSVYMERAKIALEEQILRSLDNSRGQTATQK